MSFASWTVSLSFAGVENITVTNAMTDTIVQTVAGSLPVVSCGDGYLGITFDVRARDVDDAFAIGKGSALEAIAAAGLPPLAIEQINVWSERARDRRVAKLPDVVGISEIAKMAGVSKQRAWQLTKAKDFPHGVKLECGQVFLASPVAKHISKGRRLGDASIYNNQSDN